MAELCQQRGIFSPHPSNLLSLGRSREKGRKSQAWHIITPYKRFGKRLDAQKIVSSQVNMAICRTFSGFLQKMDGKQRFWNGLASIKMSFLRFAVAKWDCLGSVWIGASTRDQVSFFCPFCPKIKMFLTSARLDIFLAKLRKGSGANIWLEKAR